MNIQLDLREVQMMLGEKDLIIFDQNRQIELKDKQLEEAAAIINKLKIKGPAIVSEFPKAVTDLPEEIKEETKND